MDDALINIILTIIGLLVPLLGLACMAFWVWMLIDCIRRKLTESEKTLWVIIILFGNLLGAIIYFFIIKNKK
ncbi:MAG: hypothetical protein UW63_C0061G0003 [Candidatus Uhrbacteria bacterium GW2011_GWF2_44_350]|uniref:Cardiolipin synthase N-terminal domain-containing protein n=1 Tax=Candidatus Uhrbacteria bacterium GW2011_GWF2_44_350 TaxID=1619000 RepID=A0A0G1JC70_9BACT|nr:MAG: hypothetical protein UW63_C0061G0003 [Candidatus Uhrbacteria bacterium GW2011_GWF2_44_350]